MKLLVTKLARLSMTIVLSAAVILPCQSWAKGVNEEPGAGAMVADAMVARPLFLATTILGAGLYIVTLPVSLMGGNAEKAGEVLVVGPAKNTFVRCLGCKHEGYQE